MFFMSVTKQYTKTLEPIKVLSRAASNILTSFTKSCFFGLINLNSNFALLQSTIILIFKIYRHDSSKYENATILNSLIRNIAKVVTSRKTSQIMIEGKL